MAARPLTFWHVAGDIIWRGNGRPVPIDVRQAHGLRAIYRDETRAAYRSGDLETAAKAAGLWVELGRALDALATYRRLFAAPDPWAQAA